MIHSLAGTAVPVDRLLEVMFSRIAIAIVVFLGFLVIGYSIGRITIRVMESFGVSEMVEGTTFERTAQGLGSSTVAVTARLTSWFIYGVGALVSLHLIGVLDANLFWQHVTIFVPRLFVALLVIIVGIVLGEKVALVMAERLRGIKVPELTVISVIAKYSIIFLAALIALSQVGVETAALLVVLGAYAFGLVIFSAIAFKDLLASMAAGIYLLLNQPYGIGDNIEIGERQGIVQEIDLFVTRIESEGSEYVVPNREFFREGIVRQR